MKTVTITKNKGEDLTIIVKEEEATSPITGIPNIPANCRVITDNDFAKDSPDVFLTLGLKHKNKLDLAANIWTFNPDPEWTPDEIARDWKYVYDAAAGMNVPPLTRGSLRKMQRPANGLIEDTSTEYSAGSEAIIKHSFESQNLVIFVGGQCTTVANAYLRNPAIANNVIVFHTNGLYNPYSQSAQGYNTQDHWSAYIVAKRMKYVNCNFKGPSGVPRPYWYDGKNLGLTAAMVASVPDSPMGKLFKTWYAEKRFEREGMADSVPILWFLNRSLWTSTEQRKLDADSTFIFVNGHNWPEYGPTLINQFKSII